MASKGRDGGEMPACSVCGGELNEQWECTICGTKHDRGGPKSPAATRDRILEQYTQIPGVGESKARALYDAGYTTFEALAAASVEELARVPGIGERLAKTIHETVPRQPPKVRAGNAPAKGAAQPSSPGNADPLAQWLAGGNDQGLSAWLAGGPATMSAAQTYDEALRRWLTGDEDGLAQWLGESGGQMQVAVTPPIAARRIQEGTRLAEEQEALLREKEREIEGLRTELEAIRRTMARELESFRSGAFDPIKYVEETARLNRELQAEIKRRRQLDQEIESIKKGSIAVIKYVKAQQMKSGASPELKRRLAQEANARKKLELEARRAQDVIGYLKKQIGGGLTKLKPDERALKQKELALVEKEALLREKEDELSAIEEAARRGETGAETATVSEELRSRMQEELREKEQEFLRREEELKQQIIHLEEQVNQYHIEARLRAESEALTGKSKREIDEVLGKKEQELLTKEKSILLREQEIQRLRDELDFTKDELDKIKQQVSYKDEELLRREEDLLYRERLLAAERRKLEEAKAQGFGTEEKEMKERLEGLKAEISQKEEEVRAKEKYLKAKMEELRLREQGLVEEEIEAREEEIMLEVKQEKVKTGSPRLDDLLLGGIPFGSNVSVYGPAYVGKEVIVNAFIAEGLKKGVPAIFVITDKTPADIREEMMFVLPGYAEYERLGLVKYIDAYSRAMGSEEQDPHTVYIQDATDHEAILKAVDEVAREIKKKHKYYRLCFRSISTLIAYLDPTTAFRFLQPFGGRRKRDRAVSLYLLEKGMHGEQEIQMLGSVMDGSLEIKVEQLKSFLAVKGVCDVQSRAWIRYTYSKQGVSIGSFSLDHIR